MNEMLYTNKPAVTALLLDAKSNRYQWNGEPWKAHKHTNAHMHTWGKQPCNIIVTAYEHNA